MTDTASVTSEHYPSSSSSFSPAPTSGRRNTSTTPHRPPPLELNRESNNQISNTLSKRPQSPISVAAAKPLLPPTPHSSSLRHVADAHHDSELYEDHHRDDDTNGSSRKRAQSIDVDEANYSHISRLSLYTPSTARGEEPRELICLCAKAPKVPRPRNAFILYRQAWQGHFAALHQGLANPEISKLIGEKWREQPEDVKNTWKQLAEEEKVRHQRQYPGYRYQPRRGGKNASGRPTSSGGDNPGRCPKCGGRYIATPRTPSTPFSVASPPSLPKRSSNMQQQYTDYPRQGSLSGTPWSFDGYGRRPTHGPMGHIEEDKDYPIMSPMAAPDSAIPPEAKRRRFNGMPVYGSGPSPHMGYAPDGRFPHRPSVTGPPLSATGYGPGHLPRPSVQYRQPLPPSHPNNPHMQPPPPPRQSMSYQPMQTPNRPSSGFDESLRLPPLQTAMQESPTAPIDPNTRQVMPPTQQQSQDTGLGIMNGPIRQPPPPAPSSPMPQKWPFLLKLEVLRSISPPLRPPGPGGPIFETRGPIIAVEGASTLILKEVAAVIERALAVSSEFAVKVWSEDTSTAIAHSSPEPHGNSSSETEGNGGAGSNGKSVVEGSNNGTIAVNGNGNGNGNAQKKPQSLISPIANYVARMLKWHKTSEDLIRYVTSFPPSSSPQSQSQTDGNGSSNTPQSTNTTNKQLPVAILSDGYSLTFSDRYASSLHVNDAYRADDHWQWVATLWRGVVGADLTVYVKRGSSASEETGGNVEMAAPGVMVLRVPESINKSNGGAGAVDEKLERRLGFEIAEWVRGGSFGVGFAR
ncbi:hypothetical protein F5Y16DRAFT_420216 [Xylariaceae sp. FL0255]|nr:hypothetical protein F5Y16DRAFT_420216 [Xylariaceae sp. FL0255]